MQEETSNCSSCSDDDRVQDDFRSFFESEDNIVKVHEPFMQAPQQPPFAQMQPEPANFLQPPSPPIEESSYDGDRSEFVLGVPATVRLPTASELVTGLCLPIYRPHENELVYEATISDHYFYSSMIT